jgi:subtilase family serine protease
MGIDVNRSSSVAPPEGARPEGAPPEGVRRSRRAALPAVATALALGAAQVAFAAPGHAAVTGRIAVGHAPTVPRGAKAAAGPADSTELTLDIALNTLNSAALKAVANEVNDPKSPYYHHFLAKGQIAEQFGASAAEVAAVDAALRAAGLTPGPVTADGLFIPVTATVAQAKAAFGTNFAGYQVGSRHVYANTTAPTVDAGIASDIAGIVGLDDFAYAVPHYVDTNKRAKANLPAHASASPNTASPNTTSPTTVSPNTAVPSCPSLNQFFGSLQPPMHDGTDYYTSDAISNIYGLGSLLANGADGTGVTVAVFELESYDPQGVGKILNCYGSKATVTEVPVDGGPTAAADLNTGVGIESALDIENIADLAPGVSIIDYAGPDWNLKTTTPTNVLDTYNKIVTDDKAQVISTSWGLCEADADPSFLTSESSVFAEAAVQGQTVVASSGDAGSTDCYIQGATTPDSSLAVDDPASQPTVLGVGGTSMSGLTNPPQTTWNAVQSDGTAGASGGGVSSVQALPAFQKGIAATGYAAHCAAAAAAGCRQVPDVSAFADPADGYVIAEFNSNDNAIDLGIIGGTSGAAPVWAAIYALADSSAACKANGNAGEAAPALYNAGKSPSYYSVFRDITSGNNGISVFQAPYHYPATSGYDMATGWGVPVASGVAAVACKGSVTSAPSYYTPVGPTRILDTRHNLGATGPVPASGTIKLQITGANGVAASNVTAVVLNVTVTANAAGGFATVYPDGAAVPPTSNLNWANGQTVPNLVVVPVGADGKVDIVNGSASTVQFVGDLAGYFTSVSSTATSTYTAVGPVRAMDTRKGIGVSAGAIPTGGVASLPVGGTTVSGVAIPSGITAVAMNVTVTAPAAGGYLTVYPNQTPTGTPVTRPTVSNLNFSTNQTIANMVIVPVGADGKVDFYNGAGATQVIADVAGYFSAGTSGAVYHALGPDRIVDTRLGLGTASASPVPANGVLTLPIQGSATAILANLTVAQTVAGGYLTAYPDGTTRPTVSNLNFSPGQAVPNLAIVPSSGKVDFFNGSGGSLRLIVDIGGYFSAS